MVIVTQNQYVLAAKIHHITMDENIDYVDARNKHGRNVSVKNASYTITIIYVPDNPSNNSSNRNDESRECTVVLRNAVTAHKIFKDLIEQIREQMPDQLYLDKALERMLAGVDSAKLEAQDASDAKDDFFSLATAPITKMKKLRKLLKATAKRKKPNDRKAKAVRGLGKAKRGSKGVLRKTK